MLKAIWNIPENNVSLVPMPCAENIPLEHFSYWQYNPEKFKKKQIKLTDSRDKNKTEVFNIIGFVSKYPKNKVSDFVARMAYNKATFKDKIITADWLINSLCNKYHDINLYVCKITSRTQTY